MRTGGAILVAIMLVVPTAAAISTRTVHDTVWDTFVPPQADLPAEVRDTTVNCDHPQNNGADFCGNLWEDEDGDVVAASPPGYVCVAEGLDLDLSLQNAFPIQKPAGVVDDHEAGPDDMKASEHGVVLSTGSFFVVPEIKGPDADQISSVWFGFAETIPHAPGTGVSGASDELCLDDTLPGFAPGVHGGYYEFYRGDTNPDDGWLIPVNTLLVPDNPYGAHLRIFGTLDETGGADGDLPTGGAQLLGTAFVYATVDNIVDDENWRPCTPTTADCDFQDTQPPWPSVTPGDVPLSNVEDKDTVIVEFGEHLNIQETEVRVNDQTFGAAAVEDGTVSADVDSFPLVTVLEDEWGPRLEINLGEDLQPGDVIEVHAVDEHGNTADKTVTL